MNLHQVASQIVGAINPNQVVAVRSSIGPLILADGKEVPKYATPGAITASIGGAFTASVPDPTNPTTLVVSAVLTGSLRPGDAVSGTDGTNALPVGATIIKQLSGTPGAAGSYQLSAGPTTGALEACEVTSASTVLNVSVVASGVLQPAQTLSDMTSALTSGTMITSQISGLPGGAGLYQLSDQQTVASESMQTSMSIVAQVQALTGGDLRHMDALNLQGSHRSLYFSANVRGAVRVSLRGGDLVTMPDGSTWLVTQVAEPFYHTAGWQKVIVTLQAGS